MSRFVTAAKFVVIAALLIAAGRLVMAHNQEQTKILVVHSYNTDMAWVNDIDDGIRQAIEDADPGIARRLNVRTHYMDLRNHPDCNFYRNAAANVRFTIDDWGPEAVIIVDDLGQALVGFNHLDFAPGAPDRTAMAHDLNTWLAGDRCDLPALDFFDLDNPAAAPPEIVFAGVNGGVGRYGYDVARNVSGIFERKNYPALIEMLGDLADAYDGPVAGVTMLNDASPTGMTESRNFETIDWAPFTPSPPVNAATEADWRAAVMQANADDKMLLIANYQNVVDAEGDPVPPRDLIAWTERHAKLPVLGANTNFVADGGMLTAAIAGSEQGRVAMGLAIAAVEGDAPHRRVEAEQFLIGMNQSLVRKRDLTLPSIYEAFSREIGTFVGAVERLYTVRAQDGA